MSYDLYLTSPTLTRESFARFFEGRTHYREAGWYANEETGIYFSFQFNGPEEDDDDPEMPSVLRQDHVAFNLNYFRPHVFGLEAEPEVSAFVSAFGCTIHDPQLHGMGDGPYSRDGFLSGWNAGNAFGYSAITERSVTDNALVVEDAAIERVWRWNLQLAAKQEADPDGHFLPRVSWAKRVDDGATVAFAVWGEGVAIALPECATHALLARELRPSMFGKKERGVEVKLLPLEAVALLAGCEWREDKAGRVLLAPTSVPPSRAVTTVFEKGFAAMDVVAQPISLDIVLNASLMKRTMP